MTNSLRIRKDKIEQSLVVLYAIGQLQAERDKQADNNRKDEALRIQREMVQSQGRVAQAEETRSQAALLEAQACMRHAQAEENKNRNAAAEISALKDRNRLLDGQNQAIKDQNKLLKEQIESGKKQTRGHLDRMRDLESENTTYSPEPSAPPMPAETPVAYAQPVVGNSESYPMAQAHVVDQDKR